MNGFIISRVDGVARVYYSPQAGRSMGAAGGGWVGEDKKDEALGFARERDVQVFLDVHLPHLGPYCTITPHQWGESNGS